MDPTSIKYPQTPEGIMPLSRLATGMIRHHTEKQLCVMADWQPGNGTRYPLALAISTGGQLHDIDSQGNGHLRGPANPCNRLQFSWLGHGCIVIDPSGLPGDGPDANTLNLGYLCEKFRCNEADGYALQCGLVAMVHLLVERVRFEQVQSVAEQLATAIVRGVR